MKKWLILFVALGIVWGLYAVSCGNSQENKRAEVVDHKNSGEVNGLDLETQNTADSNRHRLSDEDNDEYDESEFINPDRSKENEQLDDDPDEENDRIVGILN